jgi:hypothetical protein
MYAQTAPHFPGTKAPRHPGTQAHTKARRVHTPVPNNNKQSFIVKLPRHAPITIIIIIIIIIIVTVRIAALPVSVYRPRQSGM